jgi:Mg-chelatase subunit ChlD
MAALVNAIDNHTISQIGENGHVEYGWSNNIREKIAQFSFQLNRTNDNGLKNLAEILKELLLSLKHNIENGALLAKQIAKGYVSTLYKMIGQTRDIIDGKGEYTLSYMMIYTWYSFYPELAKFALRCFVILEDKTHPYGSWKDIKYFCEYCKSQGAISSHPLIQYAVKITNEQIECDYKKYITFLDDISLAAKWVPREKSSFGWLYRELACDYFSDYLLTSNMNTSYIRAATKCKTEYRKVLTMLNKHIDTLQIKQCGQKWSAIDFDKVTSISLYKQKKAFLNIKNDGEVRSPTNDRIDCAIHFKTYIRQSINNDSDVNGKRVGMVNFTKQAIQIINNNNNKIEIDLLNSQWRNNSSQTGQLGNMIAMVDVSGSMEGDPMNAAIALGIRIAEKSILGKRVMTFSAKPKWINLESYDDFVSQVDIIQRAEWGMNTNFHAALDTILDAIIQNRMAPEDVQDLVLVILSDMQIDSGDDKCNTQVLYDNMKLKYETAGIRVHGKPYKPPHILFWNLRSTNGFPTLSTQRNCSMMSGFSPALLNLFCEKGVNALQSCTPWALLEKSLENTRYKILSNELDKVIIV